MNENFRQKWKAALIYSEWRCFAVWCATVLFVLSLFPNLLNMWGLSFGKSWACFNTYCQKEWLCHPHRRAECGLQSKHCCIPCWLPPRTSSSQDYFHRSKHNLIPCLQTLTTKMHKEGRISIWRSDSRRLSEQESWQQKMCVLEKYDYSEEPPQAIFVWAVRMLLKTGGKDGMEGTLT